MHAPGLRTFVRAAVLTTVAMLPAAALAQHTHLPPGSTWTLNLSKTDFGGGAAFKSDVFVMIADTEKWGKFTETTDFGDGKLVHWSWSGPEDGTPTPLVGMKGTYASNAATDTSTETIDGMTVVCHFSLSADRKVFTNLCTTTMKDGKVTRQRMIYDRTK